jgi:hypothetical protein
MNVTQIFTLKKKERHLQTKFLPIYNSNTWYAMNINSKACTTLTIYTVSIHRTKAQIWLHQAVHHSPPQNIFKSVPRFLGLNRITFWNQEYFITQLTCFYKFTLFTIAVVNKMNLLTNKVVWTEWEKVLLVSYMENITGCQTTWL